MGCTLITTPFDSSKHRALITPAKRGKGSKPQVAEEGQEEALAERRAEMTWAQRMKRVFGIDIETCPACGGALRIIACIKDPVVIKKILTHLDTKNSSTVASRTPSCRAPPTVEIRCRRLSPRSFPSSKALRIA